MGGVIIIILFHLWNGRVWTVHHDVQIILVLGNVSHVIIETIIVGNIKCWLLWAVDKKIIPVSTVICHQVVLLYR